MSMLFYRQYSKNDNIKMYGIYLNMRMKIGHIKGMSTMTLVGGVEITKVLDLLLKVTEVLLQFIKK